ncbi:MAG: hypothetical protein WD709_02030, partial [Gammaproteobacteria bacterium]
FVRIAGKIIDSMGAGSDKEFQKILEEVRLQLQAIEPAWAGGIAPEKASLNVSVVYAAANRIEAAASAAAGP